MVWCVPTRRHRILIPLRDLLTAAYLRLQPLPAPWSSAPAEPPAPALAARLAPLAGH